MSEHRDEQDPNTTELRDHQDASESDARILARHLRGDSQAFAELVGRHSRYLYAVARRVVGPDDAEDVVQTALLNAYRSAHQFEGRAAVRTWLHRITVNEALNHVRRRAARVFESPLDDGDDPCSTEVDVDSRVVGEDLVAGLLDGLSPSTREMVLLVDLLGYSIAEAAHALGVAEGTVKSRRARAFASLARRVQP